jgi:hypothetical protein
MGIRCGSAASLSITVVLAVTTAHAEPSPIPAPGLAPSVAAATTVPNPTVQTALSTPAATPPHAPAGTLVLIAITQSLSTQTIKRGDKFPISLAAPVMLGDVVVIPAGVTGVGQVIDSQPAGALGKPGKLLLAARYLDFNGAQLPLHGMKLGGGGTDQTNAILIANMVPYVGILADFAHGGEIEIPAGARAVAKLGVDVNAPPAGAAPPATVAPPPTGTVPQGKAP